MSTNRPTEGLLLRLCLCLCLCLSLYLCLLLAWLRDIYPNLMASKHDSASWRPMQLLCLKDCTPLGGHDLGSNLK